jgi:phage-related protein
MRERIVDHGHRADVPDGNSLADIRKQLWARYPDIKLEHATRDRTAGSANSTRSDTETKALRQEPRRLTLNYCSWESRRN